MKTESICPSCRKPLPEGAPQGLCPECLMKAGFGSAAGKPGGNPKFVPPPVAELAKLFPQLEVLELIGQGGMGAVYKARQPGLDRLVALKILPPESTTEPGFAERFAREARALAKLSHPNIVAVYDFGHAGSLHYFMMEFVDGLNLRQLVHGGRLSSREALQIVPQICEALQFAHDEGIVHRDIKPENVMVDKRGRVKVADFGLAKLLGIEAEDLQLTGARDIMGTPQYMAPEQIEKPSAVDHRADIYSLGVVFYELLTGELPIGKFSPPSRKVAVDVRLDQVVLHALEKEPERRYQHASEVKSDVENITHSRAVEPPPTIRKSPEAVRVEEAYRQVQAPATGLLVTAILNWMSLPLLAIFSVYLANVRGGPNAVVVALPLLALVLSGVMLAAALKMKRLQGYSLAVAGSVLAMVVAPANVIGLPVGIWSLVVLSQRRVRELFGTDLPLPVLPPRPGAAATRTVAIVAGALLLILGIPVAAVVAAMTLPALSRAKVISTYAARFGPTHEVQLHAAVAGQPAEGLHLDSETLVNINATFVSDDEQFAAAVTKYGIDLLLSEDGGVARLVTATANKTGIQRVPNALWSNPTPGPETLTTNTAEKEGGRWVTYDLPTELQQPVTFSFQTAGGRRGLLQVTGFAREPFRAMIRFKCEKR